MEHWLLFYVVLNFSFKDLIMLCQSLQSIFVDFNFKLSAWEYLFGWDLEMLELSYDAIMGLFLC